MSKKTGVPSMESPSIFILKLNTPFSSLISSMGESLKEFLTTCPRCASKRTEKKNEKKNNVFLFYRVGRFFRFSLFESVFQTKSGKSFFIDSGSDFFRAGIFHRAF